MGQVKENMLQLGVTSNALGISTLHKNGGGLVTFCSPNI